MRVAMIVVVSACWTGPTPVVVEPVRDTTPLPGVSVFDATPQTSTWYCFDERCLSSFGECEELRAGPDQVRLKRPRVGTCQRLTVAYCAGPGRSSCTPDFATCETRALARQVTCHEERDRTTWRFSRKRPFVSGH